MSTAIRSGMLGLASLVLGAGMPAGVRGDSDSEALEALRNTVEVLKEEVGRLKEVSSIPATDEELESFSGLSPVASRVYGQSTGLSLGGYGEFFFEAPTGKKSADPSADFTRFITYVGYKFSDRVVMNTELEFEHATTSATETSKSGSVSVEFSYLDFLVTPGLNVRAGNLLVPVGLVNQMHEPPFFRGVARPTVERQLIPSTWRELGAGVHGAPTEKVRYELYALNGLNGLGFSEDGVRGGRQKGNRAVWEDVAVVARLDVEATRTLSVGGSVFAGGADQGAVAGGDADVFTVISEGHAALSVAGALIRGIVVSTSIGDAAELSSELGVTIPENQLGGYLEAAYEFSGAVGLPSGQLVRPWVRWERIDGQREVAAGLAPDPAKDTNTVSLGLEYAPHPSVVVKADWTWEDNEAEAATADPFRLGVGFVF